MRRCPNKSKDLEIGPQTEAGLLGFVPGALGQDQHCFRRMLSGEKKNIGAWGAVFKAQRSNRHYCCSHQ
jgi:hypothetical protein